MPLCFRVVCYAVIDHWNRCWRVDFYHLAIATIMQHNTWLQNLMSFNSIYFSHSQVYKLLVVLFFRLWGHRACLRLQGGSCLSCGARLKGEHLLGACWVTYIQESKCNSLKTFWYFCSFYNHLFHGQVVHIVKLKVKRMSTLSPKGEEEEKKDLLNNTATYWQLHSWNNGGGDNE